MKDIKEYLEDEMKALWDRFGDIDNFEEWNTNEYISYGKYRALEDLLDLIEYKKIKLTLDSD